MRLTSGCPLGNVVRLLVRVMWHVLQFQAQELFLNFAYLLKVCLHVLVLWLVYFVGEVDEELGVTLDGEAPHSQSFPSLEFGDQAFVLRNVVGDLLALLEVELQGVVELFMGG